MTPEVHVDLTVAGDASIDHFVQVPHIAHSDNKAIGQYLGSFGGGMSANLAAAAAAHGVSSRLVTSVGDDEESAQALAMLQDLGVDVDSVQRVAGQRTWMCFIQLDDSGEKALIGADTGIKLPEAGRIGRDVLAGSRIVAPLADDLCWALEIAQQARSAGTTVAIDLEPDAFEPGTSVLRDLLSLSDLVFMNSGSAAKLSGGTGTHAHVDAARACHERGVSTVVVGRGRHGAFCSTLHEGTWTAEAVAPPGVVDTTGAGDALAGGFLGSLLHGFPIEESLGRAVSQATASTEHLGSRTYLEDLDDIETLLQRHPITIERIPND
ncbi:hypothetical protein BH708_09590 [Brachybacterium sp. P6-10-X1]|uniref:carbohydrate kinase family protein n=1 Tax=Brachybacterium sp. P6-10-X1 TaxID=1903186 RepID=UPI000971BF2A|nr:carbohydrate kinase family protein [Brachybacterium sp. P6-10-X1]APX32926.1 hypothetical protein BH708_09590 [Brachybacterium sp. P6-10-X1]